MTQQPATTAREGTLSTGRSRVIAPAEIQALNALDDWYFREATQDMIQRLRVRNAYSQDYNKLMLGLRLIIANNPALAPTARELRRAVTAWLNWNGLQRDEIEPELDYWLSKCVTKTVQKTLSGRSGQKVDVTMIESDAKQMTAEEQMSAAEARVYQRWFERCERGKKEAEDQIVQWRDDPRIEALRSLGLAGEGGGQTVVGLTPGLGRLPRTPRSTRSTTGRSYDRSRVIDVKGKKVDDDTKKPGKTVKMTKKDRDKDEDSGVKLDTD